MAKTKEQKKEIVQKIENAFKNATSSVFVHFTKMTIADESAMRRSLRGDGVTYLVARKTLIRRALGNLGHLPTGQAGKHEGLPLEGELAIAYATDEDSTKPARLMHEFGKKLADKLMIIGGIFDGKLIGQAKMQEIAMIPSMQILRGMFVNVINSPIAGLAVALKAVADKRAA